MQRIDENTYIDDTLVTCAEYQLFIDEMREQGKYYQPDHWTSYQFPRGQAHAPILGIRFSDANTFCEWLTQREAGEWFFRIPILPEAEEYLLTKPVQSPLGYWTVGSNGNAQFTWVGSHPVNPRGLDLDLATALDFGLYNHRVFSSLLALGIASRCKLARARNQNRNRATTHTQDIDHALDLARARPFDLARDLDLALAHTSDLAIPLSRDLDVARDFDRALNLVCDINRDIEFNNNIPRDTDLVLARGLYIDIYTLQERIAGHSPAFEGIRIVKERVK